MILAVCCYSDPASINIAQKLLELGSWELELRSSKLEIHAGSGLKLLIQPQELSQADSILDLISNQHPQLVIFCSRHESASKKPMLTLHFPGELGRGLSKPAPIAARQLLDQLRESELECWLEATHHGPYGLKIPCLFLEIGSQLDCWKDPKLAELIASSILSLPGLEFPQLPILVGLGGGHYCPRQNQLLLQAKIAFGHCFASYMLNKLDSKSLKEACLISEASHLYLDWKSLDSSQRAMIQKMASELGLDLLRESQIRSRYPSNRK